MPFIFFNLFIKSFKIFFVLTFKVIFPLKILSTVSKLIFLILIFNVFDMSLVISFTIPRLSIPEILIVELYSNNDESIHLDFKILYANFD